MVSLKKKYGTNLTFLMIVTYNVWFKAAFTQGCVVLVFFFNIARTNKGTKCTEP